MGRALLIVSANVIPGKEAEFNKWYDEHHIPFFSGKMPHVKSVRRFYSRRANPQFLALYEYESPEDMKISLSSDESQAAGEDAEKMKGVLVESFSFNAYTQIYPK